VKKPPISILVTLFVGLLLSRLSGVGISIADAGVSNSGATTNISDASNSSASATITIMMYTLPGE
jgi:hypothetical protein